ncbi:MAG: GNAT family N-acetyltransferase [Dermatophilaceae bacterium]
MSQSDPVDALRPGMRAVVRKRIEHGVTDALGDVVSIDAKTVSVRTRSGLVVIERAAVVAAKEVPPKSTRRGAPHLALSMDDLERLMVEGWPPIERAELGGWLMRAAQGFTNRANSVLPLGDPGIPLSAAVDRSESWYDDRGQRALFCLFGPVGFTVDDDPLGRELLGRAYGPSKRTLVLTASTAALPPETTHTSGARVHLDAMPSPAWWSTWAGDGNAAPPAARSVMTGSPEQLFASLEVDGAVVGVARLSFAHVWAGVTAVHVSPGHRRAGVAMQLMGALGDEARARRIRSVYAQVAQANSPSQRLFERLGFNTHHEYVYLGT